MSEGASETKAGWWRRLTGGLKRTSLALGSAISDLVTKRKLDAETISDIKDVLVRADLGLDTADRIGDALAQGRHDKAISPAEVNAVVAAEVEKVLDPVAQPLAIDPAHKPFVILVAGVNGSGKTTTIGKLAAKYRAEGLKVMLAAGDTFRAAAIDQLKIWGERTGADASTFFITRTTLWSSSMSSLRFCRRPAVSTKSTSTPRSFAARTASKTRPATSAPASRATTSAPVRSPQIFSKVVGVTGLVMTKLDGTARGGILVAIAAKFKVPVHFIGVGESVDDLAPFSAGDFARAIAGVDE